MLKKSLKQSSSTKTHQHPYLRRQNRSLKKLYSKHKNATTLKATLSPSSISKRSFSTQLEPNSTPPESSLQHKLITKHNEQLYQLIHNDPFLGPLHQTLSQTSPSFPVSSKQTKVLTTPSDFYDTLLTSISNAKHRICLSALYLGSDEREQKLVHAVENALQLNPSLHVLTLFDHHRGQRQDLNGTSSFSLFANLSQKFPGRVCSALFTPPCLDVDSVNNILSDDTSSDPLQPLSEQEVIAIENAAKVSVDNLPRTIGTKIRHFLRGKASGRGKELFAVHHMKAYIIDDTTIISGANLSDIYFTNRQDRYLSIKNRELSDYTTAIIQTMAFGNKLNGKYAFFGPEFNTNDSNNQNQQQQQIPTFLDNPENTWFNCLPLQTVHINDEQLQIETLQQLLQPNLTQYFQHRHIQRLQSNTPTTTTSPSSTTPTTESKQSSSPSTSTIINNDELADMLIYPSIQVTPFGLRHDEQTVIDTFRTLSTTTIPPLTTNEDTKNTNIAHGLNMYVLTGYFNISKVFKSAVLPIIEEFTTLYHKGLEKDKEDAKIKKSTDSSSIDESTESPPISIESNSFPLPPTPPTPSIIDTFPKFNCSIVAASPQANGWWNAKGITGYVPDIYKVLINDFNRFAIKHWNNELIDVSAVEYRRDGWSYHAKGLFVQPTIYSTSRSSSTSNQDQSTTTTNNNDQNQQQEYQQYLTSSKPLYTTVGSSNYGHRSFELDSELQLNLLIPTKQQRNQLLSTTAMTQSTTISNNNNDTNDLIEQMNMDLNRSFKYSSYETDTYDKSNKNADNGNKPRFLAHVLKPVTKYFL